MQFTKVLASLALVASINAKFHNETGAAAGGVSNSTGGAAAGGKNSTAGGAGGAGGKNGTAGGAGGSNGTAGGKSDNAGAVANANVYGAAALVAAGVALLY